MRPDFSLVIFSLGAVLIVAPFAQGQAVLNNTTLGASQNDERDLANSLQPGPQKYGKGEKKLQLNTAEVKNLKSNTIKDATFGGSLLNIGINAGEPKLDASKEHSAPSEEQSSTRATSTDHGSSASKQPVANDQVSSASSQSEPLGGSTFTSLSQTANLADQLSQSDAIVAPAPAPGTSSNSSANSDNQKKGQDAAEKPSTTSSTEKSSTNKPEGDH